MAYSDSSTTIAQPKGLRVGGRYGRIGVEICDDHGSVAVVNRVQSKRLDYLDTVRSQRAARGEQAHDAEQEAQALEGDLEATIRLAHVMAAAPDLYHEARWLESWLRILVEHLADIVESQPHQEPLLSNTRTHLASLERVIATAEGHPNA